MYKTLIGITAFCTIVIVPFAIAVFALLIYRNKQVKTMIERCTSKVIGQIIGEENGKIIIKYQLDSSYTEVKYDKKEGLEVGNSINVFYNPILFLYL